MHSLTGARMADQKTAKKSSKKIEFMLFSKPLRADAKASRLNAPTHKLRIAWTKLPIYLLLSISIGLHQLEIKAIPTGRTLYQLLRRSRNVSLTNILQIKLQLSLQHNSADNLLFQKFSLYQQQQKPSSPCSMRPVLNTRHIKQIITFIVY